MHAASIPPTVIRAVLLLAGAVLLAAVVVLILGRTGEPVPAALPAVAPVDRPVALDRALLTGPEAGPWSPVAPVAAEDEAIEGPEVVVRGRGWGHSVGMSQYGAQAMATAGHTHRDIVAHYYPGTTVEPHEAASGVIAVGLFRNIPVEDRTRLDVRTAGLGGQPATRAVEVELDGQVYPVPAGQALTLTATDDGLALHGPDGAVVAEGVAPARVRFSFREATPALLHLPQLARDGAPRAGRFQWGELRVTADAEGELQPTLVLPLELYLRGLAEMPASWHPEALATQALAGRTFAIRQVLDGLKEDCACHLGTTAHDQVYAGWDKEGAAGADRWRAAVEATSGRVVAYEGELAWTYYSSSHGGRTEASEDSWAYDEAYPYLPSVDDPWSLNPGVGNPMRSWERRFAAADVARAVGLVELHDITVTERTQGGSPAVIAVRGVDLAGNEVAYDFRGWRTGIAGSDLKLTFRSELPSQQLTDIELVPATG